MTARRYPIAGSSLSVRDKECKSWHGHALEVGGNVWSVQINNRDNTARFFKNGEPELAIPLSIVQALVA